MAPLERRGSALSGKGGNQQDVQIRVLACSVGLVIALAPLASFADETPGSHLQAELDNAAAQYALAQQQVDELQAQANLSAQNERTIALLKSEEFRVHQLDVSANGMAIQQIGQALANAIRQQGEVSARNELAIAQIKASALVVRADSNLANALARPRHRDQELAGAVKFPAPPG